VKKNYLLYYSIEDIERRLNCGRVYVLDAIKSGKLKPYLMTRDEEGKEILGWPYLREPSNAYNPADDSLLPEEPQERGAHMAYLASRGLETKEQRYEMAQWRFISADVQRLESSTPSDWLSPSPDNSVCEAPEALPPLPRERLTLTNIIRVLEAIAGSAAGEPELTEKSTPRRVFLGRIRTLANMVPLDLSRNYQAAGILESAASTHRIPWRHKVDTVARKLKEAADTVE
jgi:hypothetical protein